MGRVDVHQHLWSPPLVDALRRRTRAPHLRLRRAEPAVLTLPYEAACTVAVPEDAGARTALLAEDGLERALVALSPALGVEGLPRAEAEAVIAAFEEGVAEAGPGFGWWAALPLAEPDPADVDAALARGAVGVCVPSGAVGSLGALERTGPVLDALHRAGAPLFVHPGPSPWEPPADLPGLSEPAWWPALTDYVDGMHRAWLAWLWAGRRAHPGLRVVFAMLAGLAPLQAERLGSRGACRVTAEALGDPHAFYDTSSYGPSAVEAVARLVGPGQLVLGSDRPVAAPSALPPALAADVGGDAVLRALGVPA